MPLNIFGPTYDLLGKVLDLRSQRHILVSSNIANADTPRYKAVHIKFEDELKRALPSNDNLRLKTTHKKHVPHYRFEVNVASFLYIIYKVYVFGG